MSRILVATLGSVGDLHPFLAVARALVQRGHSVLFLSSEPHRAAVEAEGVAFTSILGAHDHDRAARHPDLWHPIRGFGVLWRHFAVRSVDATVDVLRNEVAAGGDALRVLASPLVLGARLAVDCLPFRLVTAHTAPSGVRHVADPLFLGAWQVPPWWPMAWRRAAWAVLDHWKLQPMAAPFINRWREAHGLPALAETVFDRWLHSPHRTIGLYPDSFSTAADQPPVAVQRVGFPLFQPHALVPPDAALADWLGQSFDQPRIAIYAGSSHHHRAEVFHACATHLDALGCPTLLLMAGKAPGPLGQHSLIRPWVDLRGTLPRCQGWLHHGGIGASAEGLRAGVRQWTLPSAYDQFENSWYIARHLGLDTREVLLDTRQVHEARLPGWQHLNDWSHQPRLSAEDSGETAVNRAIEAILGA